MAGGENEVRTVFATAVAPWRGAAEWLVGFSGGTDSLALLTLCRELAGHPPLCAAHLHHGIRGVDADADAAFCAAHCAEAGVAMVLGSADVPALVRAEGGNLEAVARRERQRFFLRTAAARSGSAWQAGAEHARRGERILLLAHHRDDQVETVLMRLLRGSGWRGLCGIPAEGWIGEGAQRLRVVRPLLQIPRAALEAFLRERSAVPREDASNADCRLLRNRVRHRILPALRRAEPDCDRRLLQLAQTAGQVEAYVCREAMLIQRHAEFGGIFLREPTVLPDAMGRALPQPQRSSRSPLVCLPGYQTARPEPGAIPVSAAGWQRAVEEGLAALLPERTFVRMRAADFAAVQDLLAARDAAADASGKGDATRRCCNLFGDIQARWETDGLFLRRIQAHPQRSEEGQAAAQEVVWSELAEGAVIVRTLDAFALELRLVARDEALRESPHPWVGWLCAEQLQGALRIRYARPGESVGLAATGRRRRIADCLAGWQVPVRARRAWPVVCDETGVCWLPGMQAGCVLHPETAARGTIAGALLRVAISWK